MFFNQLYRWGKRNPRHLFLLDGAGALLSLFLLGVVLVELEIFFGIPISTLYFLSFFPLCFLLFDLFCFSIVRRSHEVYLRIIAFLNIAYCLLSIILSIVHYEIISILGLLYILIEVIIIGVIAGLELSVAKTISRV